MFETTSRLAEKMAIGVSRRGFLGSLGRWAGATALAMAGVLTTADTARAGDLCCMRLYIDQFGNKHFCKCKAVGGRCQYRQPFDCNGSLPGLPWPLPWCPWCS
jgi:hypothetical protein